MNSLVKKIDENISAMIQISMLNLIKLGLKYGIFNKLTIKHHYADILSSSPIRNKPLLKSLLDTYVEVGILEKGINEIKMKNFSYTITLNRESVQHMLPNWVPIFEEIYKMVDYAFITPEHPKILMDFDKDADFWDMRLSLEFNSNYRKLIASIGKLKDGMAVLDLGCGSVSPIEIGRLVGPNGKYVGIDFSPGMLSIAESRIRELRFDWVILRELDIRTIIPRNKYDIVIMSFVLEYLPTLSKVINTAMNALNENGKLIIIEPFRENYPQISAWEFFEKLTKEFTQFPSKFAIRNSLEQTNYDFKLHEIGKSVLVVEKL
ncbi:MAG: class I SAM-dependent methyltransferase [Thermococcus sp.]|uniref:class I SAM-dependent methyltransferase n=1 Tax=Thermococcus sp. TaxID=35749 RepID=UPI001DD2ED10|nr:class I SAM-dependent methyltransferase [Thermococcus sp.]MBO8175648.1 class I SAM-dependent methyltransferase [Thermococcus sp.]